MALQQVFEPRNIFLEYLIYVLQENSARLTCCLKAYDMMTTAPTLQNITLAQLTYGGP